MTTVRASIRRVLGAALLVSLTAFAAPASADPTTTPATTAPATTAPAPPASETSAAAPASAATSTTEPPAATGSHRTAWPWILMGTGVALVVTAAVLQVGAVREDDKRESEEGKLFSLPAGDPQRKPLEASIDEHDDKAKSARTAALIVGTVGFLTIAGSVVLWFYEGSSSEPSKSAKNALKPMKPRFLPSFGPSYAGASLGASF